MIVDGVITCSIVWLPVSFGTYDVRRYGSAVRPMSDRVGHRYGHIACGHGHTAKSYRRVLQILADLELLDIKLCSSQCEAFFCLFVSAERCCSMA